ncbi:hypothetical protein ASD21_09905 [Caulobacter sp. Root1455]|nr:hypothetical protein ASD21_09905 [Caulobacter sp. Root1455]
MVVRRRRHDRWADIDASFMELVTAKIIGRAEPDDLGAEFGFLAPQTLKLFFAHRHGPFSFTDDRQSSLAQTSDRTLANAIAG